MIAGLRRLSGLHPEVRDAARWALDVADYYGVDVTVTSGHRTWQEQTRLRRKYEDCLARGIFGKTAECQFPANRPGDSAHNWGLAWDSVIRDDLWQWWTYVRELAGFEVLSNDVIHAQVRNWREIVRDWPAPPR